MDLPRQRRTKAIPNLALRRLREAKGFSQARLATLAGCHQGDIAKLETGAKRTTAEWAMQLAPPLECEPRQLFPSAVNEEIDLLPAADAARQLDVKLLRTARLIVMRMAEFYKRDPDMLMDVLQGPIYDVLAAASAPIIDDEAALALVEETIKRLWTPPDPK